MHDRQSSSYTCCVSSVASDSLSAVPSVASSACFRVFFMFPLLPDSDRLSRSIGELLPGSFLLRGAMLPLL